MCSSDLIFNHPPPPTHHPLLFLRQVRVLYFVGRALFKADRPMFALHLVRGMHADQFQSKVRTMGGPGPSGRASPPTDTSNPSTPTVQEWEIFTGSLVASVSDAVPRGYPSWAPTERQAAFRLISENLPHLLTSLELENQSKWQRFAASLEAEKDMPLLRGVSPFQRVLAIQAFRPDRLQTALLNFCTELLRAESVSPPPLSLAALLAESDASTPLLLISSPGADASKVRGMAYLPLSTPFPSPFASLLNRLLTFNLSDSYLTPYLTPTWPHT